MTYLKPAKGRAARHEDGRELAEAGDHVELNSHWYRKLEDGDVVQADAPPAPDETPTASAGTAGKPAAPTTTKGSTTK